MQLIEKKSSLTRIAINNIILSFLFKMFSVFLGYYFISLTVNVLQKEQYGIWMTMLSILSWTTLCDVGLGNGLRNKLTESLTIGDRKTSREYISTAYLAMIVIVIIISLISVFLIISLDWNRIFNTRNVSGYTLKYFVFIMLFSFLLNFILSLYNQLFYAAQKASYTGFAQIILNALSIINVVVMKMFGFGSILSVAVSYSIALIISSILMTVLFFVNNKDLQPSIAFFDWAKLKDIFGVGIQVFVIQVAAMVIFTTGSIIITQIIGPSEVTSYSIIQKLFNVIIMAHTIINTPLWSLYTEAYQRREILWLRSTIKKMEILMIPIVFGIIALVLLCKAITRIWIGPNFSNSSLLVYSMAGYTLISVWNNIYSYFMNGINDFKLQMITSLIACVLNIPLSILLTTKLGNSGVVLSSIISLLPFAVIGPMRVHWILGHMESSTENV